MTSGLFCSAALHPLAQGGAGRGKATQCLRGEAEPRTLARGTGLGSPSTGLCHSSHDGHPQGAMGSGWVRGDYTPSPDVFGGGRALCWPLAPHCTFAGKTLHSHVVESPKLTPLARWAPDLRRNWPADQTCSPMPPSGPVIKAWKARATDMLWGPLDRVSWGPGKGQSGRQGKSAVHFVPWTLCLHLLPARALLIRGIEQLRDGWL